MGMTVAEDEAMTDPTAAPTASDQADAAAAAQVASPEPVSSIVDPWTPRPVDPAPIAPAAAASAAPPTRQTGSRPPSRFLADLVRAMQSTAEENRNTLVDALRAEGKTSVEQIHARSTEEVDGLRRVADEDVAGIKDWSKAEIARIRAETEERIAERKQELELSLEGHAALVEREVEHVQARIAEYETEMDVFFARLGEIEDPSEFAAMAAEMPEPPSLEEASAAARSAALDELIRETTAARQIPEAERVEDDAPSVVAEAMQAVAEPVEVVTEPTAAVAEPAEAVAEPTEAVAQPTEAVVRPAEAVAEPVDIGAESTESVAEPDEAAVAVAVAEPADARELPADANAAEAQAVAEAVTEPIHETAVDEAPTEAENAGDPRLAALGLSADAPEAEAAPADVEIDAMSEATIAARLGDVSSNGHTAPESTTSVVVIGLVSVASVASFKRTLGKVAGVRSVGVSSGPEGEFVFRTTHDADVVLKDVIPTLPGFGARVVAAGEGVVNVSARDPESEA
jgi:hypothetical protein